MAGGMNKRESWGTMAEHVARTKGQKFGHGSPEHMARPPGGSNTERWTATACHCWVVMTDQREPGLLLDWRQINGAWEGLVVRQIPNGHTVSWIPAVMLRPG